MTAVTSINLPEPEPGMHWVEATDAEYKQAGHDGRRRIPIAIYGPPGLIVVDRWYVEGAVNVVSLEEK